MSATTLAIALAAGLNAAPVVIRTDYGGLVNQYVERANGWIASGAPVRVEGVCASSCAIAIGIVAARRPDQVCARPDAWIMFHPVRDAETGAVDHLATAFWFGMFPDRAQRAMGGKPPSDDRWIRGRDSGLRECR